jgi:hypothetical protein
MCPSWVLTVDKHRRPARITLKTIGPYGFDHRANWAAKVRNVSRLGSQIKPVLEAVYIALCRFLPSRRSGPLLPSSAPINTHVQRAHEHQLIALIETRLKQIKKDLFWGPSLLNRVRNQSGGGRLDPTLADGVLQLSYVARPIISFLFEPFLRLCQWADTFAR